MLASLSGFQSHIGAIRIQHNDEKIKNERRFQSHIGAIRISAKATMLIKAAELFQSHIGAIRIWKRHRFHQLSADFNPTLVQLEWNAGQKKKSLRDISIPHWCN